MAMFLNLSTGEFVRASCKGRCREGLVRSRLACKSTASHSEHDWYSSAYRRHLHCDGR